jgi:hypothetical protein
MKKPVLVSLLLLLSSPAVSQEISTGEIIEHGVDPGAFIYQHLDKFGCQEYFDRHEVLRSCQRRGYAEILLHLCSDDPLSAIIDYVRLQLQIDYSLNHSLIRCIYQDGSSLTLTLNWSYPADPWRRDSITHH